MISNLLNNITPPNLISWFLLGVIAAFTVYLLDRREVKGGLPGTTLAGVIGGLAGGLVASLFSPIGPSGFNDASFILSVSIALLVSTIQRAISDTKRAEVETPHYDYELGRVAYSQKNPAYSQKSPAYYSQVTPLSQTERENLIPTPTPQFNRPVNPVLLEKYLSGISYPVTKQDLLTHARVLGASQPVMYTFELLPDKEYTGPLSINQELSNLSA
jgi:uncharacterized membrane protein YeaQ/YmgE (transglycosylase-associated protein family)